MAAKRDDLEYKKFVEKLQAERIRTLRERILHH
jgi:hypothetical protein